MPAPIAIQAGDTRCQWSVTHSARAITRISSRLRSTAVHGAPRAGAGAGCRCAGNRSPIRRGNARRLTTLMTGKCIRKYSP